MEASGELISRRLFEFISAHVDQAPNSIGWNQSAECQSFYVIYWVIYLSLAISPAFLYEFTQSLLPNVEISEIRNRLFCMQIAGWISKRAHGGKVIRARFQKQGRSPNDFGLSQAKSLLDRGFPRVAVAHLIVADESPEEAWRQVGVARVIDDEDHVEMLEPTRADLMPADLIRRGYGRLEARCDDDRIGLLCAYVKRAGCTDQEALSRSGIWYPTGRNAPFNEGYSPELLDRVGAYFEKNAKYFFDNPAFDP